MNKEKNEDISLVFLLSDDRNKILSLEIRGLMLYILYFDQYFTHVIRLDKKVIWNGHTILRKTIDE